ncbi:MAG: lipid A-modifier LpxR family protein [Flavobacteriaceae bacterium]
MLKNLFFIFIFIGLGNSFSQEFFGVGVDNDLYFLDDHYYSNGIFLKYGKSKTSPDSIKTKYIFWELGQKIFNPSKRFTKAVEEYDYPYGGWLYLKFSKQTILKNNSFLQWGIQTGLTGDGSLARQLQNTYHKIFLKIEEMPWTDQMPASFHVNFLLDYFKSYKLNSAMKFKTHFFSSAGTQRSSIGLGSGLIFGNSFVLPILENYLFDQKKGDGVYIGIKSEYIFHDYMISGSLFNDNAPFTLQSIPFRTVIEFGFSFHSRKWKFLIMYNQSSRHNLSQPRKGHRYLNISFIKF